MNSSALKARPSKAKHAALDVAGGAAEGGVAKGSRLGCKRLLQPLARDAKAFGVAVCRTRRVVSFGLIGRFLS